MFQQFEKEKSDQATRKRKAMSLGVAACVYGVIALVAIYAATGSGPKKPDKKSLEVTFARQALTQKAEQVKPKARPKPRPKLARKLRKRTGPVRRRPALTPPKELPMVAPREADPANFKVATLTQADLEERGDGQGGAALAPPPTPEPFQRMLSRARARAKAQAATVPMPIYLPENATAPRPFESNRLPRFPAARLQAGVGDTVVIKVVVTEAGGVRVVKVLKGQPDFVQAVLTVLPQWRFQPAVYEGERLRVYKILEVPFRIRG